MGQQQFQYLPRNLIIDFHYDVTRFYGHGFPENPVLGWQVEIRAQHQQSIPLLDYVFRLINAQLYLTSDSHRGIKIAEARPIIPYKQIWRGYENRTYTDHPTLEFPIDQAMLAVLERHRDGGSMRLQVAMQLQVEEHGIIDAHPDTKRPEWYGLVNVHNLTLQENFEIPQSEWIKRVIANSGYGTVQLLEIPTARLEDCITLSHAFKALTQANEQHRLGFYDTAVAKCRIALEEFFSDEPKRDKDGNVVSKNGHPQMIKMLNKKDWEHRLGTITYDWLNAMLGSIRNSANRTAHTADIHFDQFESQILIAVTTSLIAYAARRASHMDADANS